jgi:hypothetical protein
MRRAAAVSVSRFRGDAAVDRLVGTGRIFDDGLEETFLAQYGRESAEAPAGEVK